MAAVSDGSLTRRTAPRCALLALGLLAAAAAQAAEWQQVGHFADVTVRIDAASVRPQGKAVSAWVWFEPIPKSSWNRLLRPGERTLNQSPGKERVSVDCRARSYQVHDFEGHPHNVRYYGRPSEAVPGSEADAVLSWLCAQ